MLRRVPTTNDGAVVDRLQESTRVNKPFKKPTIAVQRDQPQRKRKRVNYQEAGGDADGSDSENEPGSKSKKKKKKKAGKDGYEAPRDNNIKKYPVYKVKAFEEVSRTFAIPSMKGEDGEVIHKSLSGISLGIRPLARLLPRPLHSPLEDHAIVLFDPTIDDRETDEERKIRLKEEEKEQAAKEAMEKTAGLYNPHKSLKMLLGEGKPKVKDEKVPVVIDPRLGKILRPHQVTGVKFMYKCTTGMVADDCYGCIMADDMGLGKTLQCITLLWTLLKQSTRAGKPTIEKCIITSPASNVRQWDQEIVKWLGKGAINTLVLDGRGTRAEMLEKVTRWASASGRSVAQPILISSYETLRSICPHLANCPIGLLLCDEGHRLKNSENQLFTNLFGLNVRRRVIISGTPLQNELDEWYSLINFANPNCLGTKSEFRKRFENVITKGRDADATDAVKATSEERRKELSLHTNRFVIRRNNDINKKYLPCKYEHVVFCRMTDLQVALYKLMVDAPELKAMIKGAEQLKAITMLKKLCNSPELLDLPDSVTGSASILPEGFIGFEASKQGKNRNPIVHCEWSGKFLVLERFLDRMRVESDDKIVLVSNYAQTLDLLERLLRHKKMQFFRLDGSVSVPKRQKMVDQFNDPKGKERVFLLSSKAGGCGINLIGANRLILLDPDWNPAADNQALARVWRDGQTKECFVYRFICTGTIEEKIYQRQTAKQALSLAVIDEDENPEHFSADALRKLFLYKDKTDCETHETLNCKRCKNGKQFLKSPAIVYGNVRSWNHHGNEELKNNHDDLLRAEYQLPEVSYVFQYISLAD